MSYPDMFSQLKPKRKARRVMMHGVDFGYDGDWTLANMVCDKCGLEHGWVIFDCDSEAKRGMACPKCNDD